MTREDELESTLRECIEQTEQAVEEGWIYSPQFNEMLSKAKKVLSEPSEKDSYPDHGGGFHVLQQ